VGVLIAGAAHLLVPTVGVLTWSVLLGAALANTNLVPGLCIPGLRIATRKLLRTGVALLGFSLPVASVLALGLPVLAVVTLTLFTTLLGTFRLGTWLGLGGPRSLLFATGFSICGASAIAAIAGPARADDDDVAAAVAMVTIWGSIAMIVLPFLQHPLGLTEEAYGVWAGGSIHEVGQVVAAAGPAGATAVAVAMAVKLTRVLLLAPIAVGVSILQRRSADADAPRTAVPPVLPLFVLGFLFCSAVRSTGTVPHDLLTIIGGLQTTVLGAALFALGTSVHLSSLVRGSRAGLAVGMVSTVWVTAVCLAGVLLLA
jgi:uncharacterized integral membrane protein (TIGR00698 family)